MPFVKVGVVRTEHCVSAGMKLTTVAFIEHWRTLRQCIDFSTFLHQLVWFHRYASWHRQRWSPRSSFTMSSISCGDFSARWKMAARITSERVNFSKRGMNFIISSSSKYSSSSDIVRLFNFLFATSRASLWSDWLAQRSCVLSRLHQALCALLGHPFSWTLFFFLQTQQIIYKFFKLGFRLFVALNAGHFKDRTTRLFRIIIDVAVI